MRLIKWLMKVKNIGNIKNIIIISVNQNNLINIVNEETELYFYTLINQEKLLIQIDDKTFDINLLDESKDSYNYEHNNIIKAILFYKKLEINDIENIKQNKLNDRYIYMRKYNTLVPEYKNSMVFTVIRDILNNSYFGSDTLLYLLTVLMGSFLQSSYSKILINPAIKNYNIKTDNYNLENITSFNDFFIRELKKPMIIESNYNIIYSVASARSVFFNFKNYYKLNLYIKGKNFDLAELINEERIRSKYSVVLYRLALNDYHHVHMPEDGILIDVNEFNGKYRSIDKDYIRSKINVMNDNKRVVFKFKRNNGTLFYLVMVGSTIVSSIVHNLEINKQYYTKEKIAYFQFGGSCVVYVSDQNIYFDSDLLYYSNENIESYTKVGEEIGNLYYQKDKPFVKNYYIKRHITGFLNNLIELIINILIFIHKKFLRNLYLELI